MSDTVRYRAIDETNPYADLIRKIKTYAAEKFHGRAHQVRWWRVLEALGAADTAWRPMPAAEARVYQGRGWRRWDPVVEALTAIEARAAELNADPVEEPVHDPEPEEADVSRLREDSRFLLRGKPLPEEDLLTIARFQEGGASRTEYVARLAYLNSLSDADWSKLENYPAGGYKRDDRTDTLADPNTGYGSLDEFQDMVEAWLKSWVTVAQQVREEQRKEKIRAQIASRKQEQDRQRRLRKDAGYRRHNGDPRQGWVHDSADVDKATRVASNAVVHGGTIRESTIGSRSEIFGTPSITRSRIGDGAKIRDNARLEGASVYRAEVRDSAALINAGLTGDPWKAESFIEDEAHVEGTVTTDACRDWQRLNGGWALVIEGQVSGKARIVGSGRHRDRIGGNARLIGANINTVGNLNGDAELGDDTWVQSVVEVRCKVAAPGFKCSTTRVTTADGRRGGPPILRKGWEVRGGKVFDETGSDISERPHDGGIWWTTQRGDIERWMGGYSRTKRAMKNVVRLCFQHPQPQAAKTGSA